MHFRIRNTYFIFLCLLTLVSVSSSNSYAANIFSKPKPKSPQIESPQPDSDILELLDEAPKQEPKTERQQPKTITEYANAYYKNCRKQDHPLLKGESLDILCSCTAAQIPDVMTLEQWRSMGQDNPEGQLQRNRMLMFIYTPCIKYPTRALIMDKCMNDAKVKATMRRYPKVCACLADDMALYMDENAMHTVEQALARNQKDLDPLASLLESRSFERRSEYAMSQCVKKHEFGKGR